jgi:GT2 family glycosyltransferase/glycosyltransferase involved in cell wall biosynthesis
MHSEQDGQRERHVSELAALTRDLDMERRRVAELRREFARFEGSVTWQLFQRARRRLYGRIGYESRAGRAVGATLRFVGRRWQLGWGGADAERRWEPVTLPRFPEPIDASIVIAVHGAAEPTERCLRAIVENSAGATYEVVIVDDAADADTKALLEVVEGARVVVNDANLGYLRSVNRGAAVARGRHIVLLNDDTEPQPGWLRALVERADSAADVGVVAAKLVYPDGILQQAGGIVWRDGEPWLFGHGHSADAPEYNYVREIDYGSAAALLVRGEAWRAAGGFDTRFDPCYFEDTDLCFTARRLGWRVLYEPRATVVHVAGATMGTEPSVGYKRYQQWNQPKFIEKWSAALQRQPERSAEDTALSSDRRDGPQVLVIDHRVPTPDRDSGSLRMWSILTNLLELGCRVAFLPDDLQPLEPYSSRLRGMGVKVLDGPVAVPAHVASLSSRLRLVLVSRPYVAARYFHLIREHAPDAVLAYDTVDLHFLREQRRVRHEQRGNEKIAATFRELELALARSADVTVVVSEQEREHLRRIAPEIPVEVVPNANEIATEVPGPEDRSGLLFVGGFEHPPNADAVMNLVQNVMPRVWRSLPEVGLTVVGADPPPAVLELASSRVDVRGWVEELEPLMNQSMAMVAPLRYGAGMKGKVTQSLAVGLPVVTTTIGAEGLEVEDGRDLSVADEPVQLAERIVALHSDPRRWRELSENGRAVARRACSPAVQREAVRRLLSLHPGASVEPLAVRSA